jgi:hypothetical protein
MRIEQKVDIGGIVKGITDYRNGSKRDCKQKDVIRRFADAFTNSATSPLIWRSQDSNLETTRVSDLQW